MRRLVAALVAAGALAAGAVAAVPAYADSTGMSALVSSDCTNGRLQLVLNNQTSVTQTFTVTWPGRSGSPWTRTLNAGTNTLLYWTVPTGTAYNLTTTTPTGFNNTQSGTYGCGLGSGQPQMNNTTLLTTSTVIDGLNGTSGLYNGTVASVRIPALGVTNSGTIIAVADARVSSDTDLPNNIQLAMRRSTDGGNTWSTPKIIVHAPTTSEGTGDSSILVDRATGRVFLFYNYGPPGIGFNNATASGSNSATDTKSLHVQYVTSDDDGQTWSSLVDLNPSVKDPSWVSLFASSGHGIQLSGGRLVQPLVYKDSAGTEHAADIYSDDNGSTWRTSASAGTGVNESKAIERSTGTVTQNLRPNTAGHRIYADSTDQATTFGSEYTTSLLDPGCNADELSYLKPTDVGTTHTPLRTATAIYSGNNNSTSRINLTVQASTDDGASWPHSALLQGGTAGYSTTAVENDGTIGDLYEVGSTAIFYDRFTLSWLNAA